MNLEKTQVGTGTQAHQMCIGLIATDNQIDQGIREALSRVRSEGVFVEGNSFSQFIETDYFVMVKSAGSDSIKKSAKAIVSKVEAVYLSEFGSTTSDSDKPENLINGRPTFIYGTLPSLILEVRGALTDVADGSPLLSSVYKLWSLWTNY